MSIFRKDSSKLKGKHCKLGSVISKRIAVMYAEFIGCICNMSEWTTGQTYELGPPRKPRFADEAEDEYVASAITCRQFPNHLFHSACFVLNEVADKYNSPTSSPREPVQNIRKTPTRQPRLPERVTQRSRGLAASAIPGKSLTTSRRVWTRGKARQRRWTSLHLLLPCPLLCRQS